MWGEGNHSKKPLKVNEELESLKGDLPLDVAQITLAKYLYANLHGTVYLLTGMDIYPFQEIALKTMFLRDYVLYIAGRGLSKSFTGAWFAMLYAIFNPGTRIGICSAGFRQAKEIFSKIETWANSKGGIYLRQCLKGKPAHDPDAWKMEFNNGSIIIALPLGSSGRIRGYRFNVMIIDELLLLNDKVMNEVITPFMAIQADAPRREEIRQAENRLIKAGLLNEDDRYKFTSNKLIGLSSASYQFEFLYRLYSQYKEFIFGNEHKNSKDISHAILQLSCEMAPAGLYDPTAVENARKTSSAAQFAREYMAQFTDDSSSYFSPKKMEEATVASPTIKLVGDKDKKYILAIDPNYDSAESSDHFAMCLIELNFEDKTGIVVHNYALSKGSLKSRSAYLNYLFNAFDIVYVICDKAGGVSFINDINDTGLLEKKLAFFEHDFLNEDQQKGLSIAKASYLSAPGKIVHSQYFDHRWIRLANELLQTSIEKKRIQFAGDCQMEENYEKQMSHKIPIHTIEFAEGETKNQSDREKQGEFIEHQAFLIKLLKKECSMIEVTTTNTGVQKFDLPSNLLKDKSPERARKDSYTALLLGVWGLKCYFELLNYDKKTTMGGFVPRFVA